YFEGAYLALDESRVQGLDGVEFGVYGHGGDELVNDRRHEEQPFGDCGRIGKECVALRFGAGGGDIVSQAQADVLMRRQWMSYWLDTLRVDGLKLFAQVEDSGEF